MTKDEAIEVLNMVEAHGLADEAKRMAIEALSEPSGDKGGDAKMSPQTTHMQQSPNNGADLISRADAIEAVRVCDVFLAYQGEKIANNIDGFVDSIVEQMRDNISRAVSALPTADRPTGEWINKDVIRNEDNTIDEWQECECSVCGKWHTTPYAYYFNNYNYCPNCGAKMKGEEDD